jgi:WbqC-like protein family
MTVVAAHQPNFLPWLGFFDKLARADVLVLLDDVQFPRTGAGTWLNRVRVVAGGAPTWLTVPVLRAGRGLQEVRDVELDDAQPWRRRVLRTLETSYGRSPGFAEAFPLVRAIVEHPERRLAAYNEHGIRVLADALGLDASRLVHSSSLAAEGHGTDLLISLTRAAGGTTYLSGDGAEGYQEPERYAAAGVELRFQEFRHPAYPQPLPEPVHGLSVVDALMSCGVEGAGRLLQPRV